VEEALNALPDAEVDHLCGARIETRKDKRTGSYDCQCTPKPAEVALTVPKLR